MSSCRTSEGYTGWAWISGRDQSNYGKTLFPLQNKQKRTDSSDFGRIAAGRIRENKKNKGYTCSNEQYNMLCFIIGKFDIRRTLDKKVSSTLFDLFSLFSLHYVDTKVKICTEKFL